MFELFLSLLLLKSLTVNMNVAKPTTAFSSRSCDKKSWRPYIKINKIELHLLD